MSLGQAGLRCLREMLADPHDLDIVREGISAYCGNRRIASRTVNALIRCSAIEGQLVAGFQRFTVKVEIAQQIVDRPELADEIEMAYMRRSGPFQVVGGHVVPLADPVGPTPATSSSARD